MFKKYRSIFILISSIIIGVILGVIFKEKITIIKPLGDIFLNLMFTIVIPLILTTVISSITNIESLKKLGRILKYILIVFIVTSLISGILMFIVLSFTNLNSNIVLESSEIKSVSFLNQVVGLFTVSDFINLFSKSNIMPLIIFSILFGISLLLIDKQKKIISKINILEEVFLKMVKLIMLYAPIGLCAYFACLVGEFGPSITYEYIKIFIIYLIVSILYMLIFYTIYSYIAKGIDGVKIFWKNIIPSILTSLATQSSLATLPINLDVASKMGLKKSSKVTLSLGSTMHMEGSAMAAVLKIMFIFSILHIDLTLSNVILMLIVSVLSAVVMAGIPAGGLIGETLIISLFGFPTQAFIPIAAIGILVDAPATMLNATGDIASSMLVDKIIDS